MRCPVRPNQSSVSILPLIAGIGEWEMLEVMGYIKNL